ncbi:MAG: sulfotransferase family 2 domain-containing protein [Desulfobacteraceae bacterium]|nr:sulfotransferase family 2 domain-containing protein [Desulfobacteraceae bacterium]
MTIVSHRHKFIFLKTLKTAGTSIEFFLYRFLGENDIVRTSIEDGVVQGIYPRNYFKNSWRDHTLGDVVGLGRSIRNKLYQRVRGQQSSWTIHERWREKFRQHMPAREVRKRVGESVWNNYYKFSVERNPWDRMVSLYYWRTHGFQDPVDFKIFILAMKEGNRKKLRELKGWSFSNWDIYAQGSEVVVDKLCKLENLNHELEEVLEYIGLDIDLDLPRAKSHTRKNKNYREMYDEESMQLVAELFSREIELLGYSF